MASRARCGYWPSWRCWRHELITQAHWGKAEPRDSSRVYRITGVSELQCHRACSDHVGKTGRNNTHNDIIEKTERSLLWDLSSMLLDSQYRVYYSCLCCVYFVSTIVYVFLCLLCIYYCLFRVYYRVYLLFLLRHCFFFYNSVSDLELIRGLGFWKNWFQLKYTQRSNYFNQCVDRYSHVR